MPGGVLHGRPVVSQALYVPYLSRCILILLRWRAVLPLSTLPMGWLAPRTCFIYMSYQEGTKGTAGALGPSERDCYPANPSLTKSFLLGQLEENVVIWATLPFYR